MTQETTRWGGVGGIFMGMNGGDGRTGRRELKVKLGDCGHSLEVIGSWRWKFGNESRVCILFQLEKM